MRNLCFEAAFLRAGLLVGLIHEQDVPAWAEAAIDAFPSSLSALAGVLCAPVALSPMREALQAVAAGFDDTHVADALLSALAQDAFQTQRPAPSIVRVLSDIRRELRCPTRVSHGIKGFEDRLMLADVAMRGAVAPTCQELLAWLDGVRPASLFVFQFANIQEAAAFAGAVTRAIARKGRPWDTRHVAPARGWVPARTSSRPVIVVNEPAWATVAEAFSPLPLVSRIPYADRDVDGLCLFDESHIESLGMDAAAARLRQTA